MKLVIDNTGQTCNKFWSYLAPLSHALKTGEKVYVLFPDKEIEHYSKLLHNPYLRIFHLPKWLIPLKKQETFIRRLFTNRYYRLLPLLDRYFKKHIWYTYIERDYVVDVNEKQYVIDLFTPNNAIKTRVDEIFQKIKTENQNIIIIGVHIRRGDYAIWRNGLYFYSFEYYKKICERLKQEFKNRDVKFFISSNEKIDSSIFSPPEYFSIPSSSAPTDLYSLSQCDYIIGPPSTFSRWAAFYNDKYIRFILPNNKLTKEFRKLKSLEKYSTDEIVTNVVNGTLQFG